MAAEPLCAPPVARPVILGSALALVRPVKPSKSVVSHSAVFVECAVWWGSQLVLCVTVMDGWAPFAWDMLSEIEVLGGWIEGVGRVGIPAGGCDLIAFDCPDSLICVRVPP